mmetsp:Transcript_52627/g.125726  ORF Transcript_52627/g.125726 Transcript_52627/m.125726 type:complete len:278 (+) Transcript_52627:99-932(+)|eukprot:CAMPEP_0178425776 /NCGR_PEP_ID=MMETSP0689_2-20121128/28894_1 /TAXON_ID=160604 /ORGANISM="Amphidinium massartii, Strain CS-259" /LENGTH=277 /DNA_ID=CAMNT_0020047443 /DNA_START=23 /DNA_END=856 /DNA_ORIENTATION=+
MAPDAAWQDDLSFSGFSARLQDFVLLRCLADKCGLQPWVVAVVMGTLMASICYYGLAGEFACRLLGFAFPVYGSFKALEDGRMEDVGKWMQYWIVFGITMLTDGFFKHTLLWIPFFSLFRLAFIAWLFMPSTQGACGIYSWVVRPLLRRHRFKIDALLTWLDEELRQRLARFGSGGDHARESERGAALEEIMVKALRASAAPAQAKENLEAKPDVSSARRRMASPAPRSTQSGGGQGQHQPHAHAAGDSLPLSGKGFPVQQVLQATVPLVDVPQPAS